MGLTKLRLLRHWQLMSTLGGAPRPGLRKRLASIAEMDRLESRNLLYPIASKFSVLTSTETLSVPLGLIGRCLVGEVLYHAATFQYFERSGRHRV